MHARVGQMLEPGADQRLAHALAAMRGSHRDRRERDGGDGLAGDLHGHAAERHHAREHAVVLVVRDQRQHHVAVDAQPLDQHRLIGGGEGGAQQRVDGGHVPARGRADGDAHDSAMSGASSAFMPMTL